MYGALTTSSGSTGAGSTLLMLGAVLGVLALYLLVYSWAPCGECRGEGKHTSPLEQDRWRVCLRCNGSGKKRRTGWSVVRFVWSTPGLVMVTVALVVLLPWTV